MGTELQRGPTPRQAVFEDLTHELQALRDGTHAATMAQALLQYALDSRDLVAVLDDCERAVFYTANTRLLVAVPFDKHGLDIEAARQEWGPISDPTMWIDAYDEKLTWVHPRYRWILDEV